MTLRLPQPQFKPRSATEWVCRIKPEFREASREAVARVTSVAPSPIDSGRTHPTTVTCEWRVFDDGELILQLDSRGSSARQFPDKLSQTLQFTHDTAVELVDVIAKVFPDAVTHRE
jgi:hypothetical protein